ICFVDVSTLNVEDKDSKGAAGSSSEGKLNLENLEEKEIIVIKDTEKQDQSKRLVFLKRIRVLKLTLLSPQLPEVSAKAAGKGYCVGDLLLEVMKFAKERQLDEAIGNMARKQLLDWLLANL
ncbi:A-kinase anchor protein 4, partial [Lemmus lemmus]